MRARSHTTRFGLCILGLLLAGGVAREAAAQTGLGGSSGTTTFTTDDFRIVVQQSPGAAYQTFELGRLFNAANCRCQVPIYLFFTLSSSGFQKASTLPEGSIEFWTGLTCNDNTTGLRSTRCRQLQLDGGGTNLSLSAFVKNGGVIVTSDAQTLSQNFGQPQTAGGGGGSTGSSGTVGPSGPEACETNFVFSQGVWALVTFAGSTTYDVVTTIGLDVDLAPPPAVDGSDYGAVKVDPGNEALIVNWTGLSSAVVYDITGYQILCDRGGELQVFKNSTFGAGFATCNQTVPSGLDGHVMALDPNFICSPLLSATATSYRVKILENTIQYGVAVVAIDSHLNASTPVMHYKAPEKTLNFYDTYRNGDSANQAPHQMPDPGRASGGYCSVGSEGAGAPGGGTTGTVGPSGPEACETNFVFSQGVWALVSFAGSTTYDVVTTIGLDVTTS